MLHLHLLTVGWYCSCSCLGVQQAAYYPGQGGSWPAADLVKFKVRVESKVLIKP
jgi:hypothetical protein